MPEHENEAEANLRLLSERLHAGWAKLYPATPKERAAVREAVRKQWEQEQERKAAGGKARRSQAVEQTPEKPAKSGEKQERTKPAPKPKSQDKDWGHSY
jgi:hypothetical protein